MPSKCTEELFSRIPYFLLLDFSILCKISNPSQPNNAQGQQDRYLSIERSMFYSQLLGSSKFHTLLDIKKFTSACYACVLILDLINGVAG